MSKLPTYFISHGGGPWPWLRDEMPGVYDKLEASLVAIPRQLPETPRAIVMVSGHWEGSEFAVMGTSQPPMLYDYGGFPSHTYRIQYPAPGDPKLAEKIVELLKSAQLPTRLELSRGFDHGTFVPLVIMYPEANVPVVQISLKKSYDPAQHWALGRALKPLREEGILLIGSGLSYHNLKNFGAGAREISRDFDQWLEKTLLESSAEEREKRLLRWSEAPSARAAHPREDHLMPLFVVAGAAESENVQRVYHERDFMGALSVSSFRFG